MAPELTFRFATRVAPKYERIKARLALLLPALLALVYPFLLAGFHACAAAGMGGDTGGWIAAALFLLAALAVPIVALLGFMAFAASGLRSVAQTRAGMVALLAVAAPTMFVFLGVVLFMLHDPVRDTWIWCAAWISALLFIALADSDRILPATITRPSPPWLRTAHGVSALCIIVAYLSLHLGNHLFFLAGSQTYNAVQKLFRHFYRAEIVQPILVALFLFQVGSGISLAVRKAAAPMDRFRAFQVASGIYLVIYILGHMDSVFIYARTYMHIDSDWAFATGAPSGLIANAWNIRLVPHYGLGVFFVVAHAFAGFRSVMLSHNIRKPIADRIMIGGAIGGAVLATVIILGMCGARLSFTLSA